MQKITPCLWYDSQAEDAARFYASIFANSSIDRISRYLKAGPGDDGKEEGSVLTVEFTLDGQAYTALNGGPMFTFSEAISLQVECRDQAEVDYYWEKLTEGGGEEGPCGWLKDKFGLSWQVTPKVLPEMLRDPDTAKSGRVWDAFMKMHKFDIAALERAYAG